MQFLILQYSTTTEIFTKIGSSNTVYWNGFYGDLYDYHVSARFVRGYCNVFYYFQLFAF